jgi:putative transposase
MTRFVHPLLLLIARFTNKQLAQLIEYLLAENRILRAKLPKRIEVAPAERAKLVKLGKPLGSKLKDILSIVSYRTFCRWANETKPAAKPPKPGRPRKPEEIRELILQIARETGWGYRKILGELKKLRIRVSRATVARILRENGFDLGPKRARGSWSEFVKRHFKTLWATDFFTQTVWTMRGPVVYYMLFFIHLETRRVHLAGMTPNPDSTWMAQQARNLSIYFAEQGEFKPTHIIRDRDTKFTTQFCSILESEGIEFRPIPPRSPNLNPYSEAWVQRTKHEVLNHFLVFGERHLRYILKSWLEYYHRWRPHQGLGNVRLEERNLPPPELSEVVPLGEIICHESLDGLLRHYERKAA